MSEPRLRGAVRGVVVDPPAAFSSCGSSSQYWTGWATPGGGVDPDESDEEALRRALAEEAGVEGFELGPLVWRRTHLFELGINWDGQVERYYLVRAAAFQPAPRLTWAELNAEYVTAVRWWPQDQLEATDARFAPRELPRLVRELVADGAPVAPLDVGVQEGLVSPSSGS